MGQGMGLSSSSLSLQGLAGGPSPVLQVTGAADSIFIPGQDLQGNSRQGFFTEAGGRGACCAHGHEQRGRGPR